MIINICSLKLIGGNFIEEEKFDFFRNKTDGANERLFVLYGKNGSGKTTISRAFNKIIGNNEDSIVSAKLIDCNDDEIILNDNEKSNIFVFNEDFVYNKIKYKDDGLDTIVVFGDNIKLENELEKLKKERESSISEIAKIESELKDYTNIKSEKSPDYWINQIKIKLKGSGNWAEREYEFLKIFENRRVAPKVEKETYKNFINRNPQKNVNELYKEYTVTLNTLINITNGKKELVRKTKISSFDLKIEERIIKLLSQKIENSDFNEREKYLIESARKAIIDIEKIEDFFEDKNNNICPYCLQKLSIEYKELLLSNIKKILNKDVENHKNELLKTKIQYLEIDKDENIFELGVEIVNKLEILLNDFNKKAKTLNENIDNKIKDVYKPIIVSPLNLNKIYNKLQDLVDELEKNRNIYNEKFQNIEKLINKLKEINADIAYYDILNENISLQKAMSEKNNKEIFINECRKKLGDIDNKISEILVKMKKIEIAMNSINKWLEYIYFNDNYFKLEYNNDRYILKLNGKSIKPSQISAGERNIIALCYFFF